MFGKRNKQLHDRIDALGRKKIRGWYLSREEFTSPAEKQEFLNNPDNELKELYLNPYTIEEHTQRCDKKYYRKVQIDTVWNCNLHCSYCDFQFDKRLNALPIDRLRMVLDRHLIGASRINLGSYAEPMMNRHFMDYVEVVGETCRPDDIFNIQTNGYFLDRYDAKALSDNGINMISVSIDALNPGIQRRMRDGSDVGKLFKSLAKISETSPDIHLRIVAVVTKQSYHDVGNLVAFAASFGIHIITVRHVLVPESKPNVKLSDGTTVANKDLKITPFQYLKLKEKLLTGYGDKIEFEFSTHAHVVQYKLNKDQGSWRLKTWSDIN